MLRVPIFVALMASAATAFAGEKRELSAHQHGVGALNLAFEASEVLIELEAPGADIVGFEHPAESAEDRAKIDAAIAVLARPLDLFVMPKGAGCSVVAAEVSLIGDGDHDDHSEEAHGHGHSEEAHGHDHGDEHAEAAAHGDHDEHAGEEESHTEFHAEYSLTCSEPGAIDQIDFAYFAQFPNAEELEVQMISDKGSQGFEVERAAPSLALDGLI
ncbi:MAG: DUF2796 domain-containing protein [Pseudomonadota bacterium]